MRNLLEFSRELAAIAQAGLTFTKDPFDRERFVRLRQMAGELLCTSDDVPKFEWPVDLGYPTPKVDVRAAVFQDRSILLIKETSTALWTLPGGWADVNLTPAQNAEKECLEETGYIVKARLISSIIDRDQAGYPTNPNAIYKIFVLCDIIGGSPQTSIESSQVEFFPIDDLPELDRHRATIQDIMRAFDFHLNPNQPAHFN